MLENAAESPASGARFVGTLFDCKTLKFNYLISWVAKRYYHSPPSFWGNARI